MFEIYGASWSGSATALDGFTIQAVPASGSNPTNTLAIKHSSTNTGGSQLQFGTTGQLTVSGAGNITTLGGKTLSSTSPTGAAGIVYETLNTGLTANFNSGSAQTMYTPSGAYMYTVNVYIATTTAATSSSTMPSVVIGWTDAGGTARTNTLIATSNGNVTTYYAQATMQIYTQASTAITVTVANYASSGATALKYCFACNLEIM